jgi:hypothetical protein
MVESEAAELYRYVEERNHLPFLQTYILFTWKLLDVLLSP